MGKLAHYYPFFVFPSPYLTRKHCQGRSRCAGARRARLYSAGVEDTLFREEKVLNRLAEGQFRLRAEGPMLGSAIG